MNTHSYGFLITAVLMLATAGCRTSLISDNDVLIRIQNNSAYEMQEVKAIFPKDEISYDNVGPGDTSPFEDVTEAYRYAYIEMIVQDKKLVLQPIDYVGESLLDPGLYTYVLNIDEDTFHSDNYRYALTLQLKEE